MADHVTAVQSRRNALARKIAEAGLDALLITAPMHVRYLTGFSGSNAALLLSHDGTAEIATDGRYTTQIAQEAPDLEAVIKRNCPVALLARVDGAARVGFEAALTSVAELNEWREAAPEGVSLQAMSGMVESLRLVKDAHELRELRAVAELANEAFATLVEEGGVAPGRTELAVAARLEYLMRAAGAEGTSFDTIVASGPNSAKPHHGAENRALAAGDLVTIDFGATRGGYNSDMTRTLVVGQPDDFASEIYEVVRHSHDAGVAAATPGTALTDVDAASREVIERAGYGDYFVHSTGHGVGIEVHEEPSASRAGVGVLEPGMTLTIEPGIYIPQRGGVRIEDTLIIGSDDPEIITRFPTELTCL